MTQGEPESGQPPAGPAGERFTGANWDFGKGDHTAVSIYDQAGSLIAVLQPGEFDMVPAIGGGVEIWINDSAPIEAQILLVDALKAPVDIQMVDVANLPKTGGSTGD